LPSTRCGESVAGEVPGGPWRLMNMTASVWRADCEASEGMEANHRVLRLVKNVTAKLAK